MDDLLSSTNYKFNDLYSVTRLEFSSEDSGWSLYLEDSITSNYTEESVVFCRSESSLMFPDALCSVKRIFPSDDHVASAAPILKRRKTKPTFVDHELEDTASSLLCHSKVQDLEQDYAELQETEYSLDTLPPEQLGKHDRRSFSEEKSAASDNEAMHLPFVGKDIKYAGLRQKGLCLLPISMLFNFF